MSDRDWAERLRERARKLLEQTRTPDATVRRDETERSLTELIHELDTYGVELNLQHEQLQHSEQDLRALVQRYDALWGALPMAVLVVDALGTVQRANDRAAELFGFRAASLLEGYSILRSLTRQDRQRVHEALSSCKLDRELVLDDVPVVSAPTLDAQPASKARLELHCLLLPLSYHLDRHVLISALDRSEVYAYQAETRILKTLVDAMDAEISAYDTAGQCLFANTAAAAATGVTVSDMVGERRERWMTAEGARRNEQQDAVVVVQRRPVTTELSVTRGGAEGRTLSEQRFPLLGADNSCIGVGLLSTDITNVRAQEQANDIAEAARNISRDAIMVTDADNRIVSVNEAFERVTGYARSEVLWKDPKLLASGYHDRAFFAQMWRSIRAVGRWEGEIWNRRKNGELFPEFLTISCVRDRHGAVTNYVAVFSDIGARKAAEERIQSLAYYDVLTGLPNRKLLADRVTLALSAARRDGSLVALIYFDLDHFKRINDTHGHKIGDEVLKEVAKRVSKAVRETDTLSRLGGDEFVLLLTGIAMENVEHRLEALLQEVNQPFVLNEAEILIGASFGVALSPEDGTDLDTLLKHADTAMYEAKEQGRATARFFNRAMAERVNAQARIVQGLHRAIANRELSLVFQPQFTLGDGALVGAEALLRWRSPTLGQVSPAEFIPLAERTGVIVDIGRWVIRHATETAAALQRLDRNAVLAVNLSARQLHDEELLPLLRESLEANGVEPSRIELEITESLLMQEADWALALLGELKGMGFRLAIDDFGTGFSSLAYLNWMPVDTLKIDRAFVQGVDTDEHRGKVCRSIITLAKGLGLTVVAEGIESEAQRAFLHQEGCDRAQGFLLARPLPEAELLARLS
jgi:two-component system CheB/CheR fusion protein